MDRIRLNGEWQVVGFAPDVDKTIKLKATVPGSTLNDIINADLEKCDIFYRTNADKYQKYERYSWVYSKDFEIKKTSGKINLVLNRLDTYCDILLNDEKIAYFENAHISHNIDITDCVRDGNNNLKIKFYSAVEMTKDKPKLNGAFTTERLYTRRTQSTYGWDWVARFVSCGIGGDVYIEMYEQDEPKIDGVYVYTKSIDAYGAYIGLSINFGENFNGKVYDFEIYDDEGNLVKKHTKYCSFPKYEFNLSIENAKLWYPTGYGSQPLYEIKVKNNGKALYSEKFGIRTVKIMQTVDQVGSDNYNKCLWLKESSFSKEYDHNIEFSGFQLVVNGVKIVCRGANWVPCEPFDNGRTKEKILKILHLSKEMGLNMIRVWGGGTFEIKEFYEECSKLGIMVTQDFLMACGQYPEKEDWFIEHLSKEAEYIAKLIRNEPCLMWWNGDNENALCGDDIMEDHPGRASAMYGIHPVLMELDSQRDFFPSSPYGGSLFGSNTVGTTHNTQFLGNVFSTVVNEELDDYKERHKKLCARFIAEEPTFGAISTYSMKKFMTDEDIYGDDLSVMQYHTKTNPYLEKELFEYFTILSRKVLGEFKDGYDRLFKMKYIQHECVRLSLEQLRRERGFISGVIFWMLQDCWPAAAGWTFIDYYLMPKASYYSFKRCSKPVICSIDKKENEYSVYVCNDREDTYNSKLTVSSIDIKTGKQELIFEGDVSVDSFLSDAVCSFECADDLVIVAKIDGDMAFYKNGTLKMTKTDIDYKIERNTIVLKAGKYVHSVEIEGNVILEDNYFSMLPGEEKTISFTVADEENAPNIQISAYTIE